jgi:diguanylate cyclase (GGDEF)-like protein/PAS domain S-box-containing protein
MKTRPAQLILLIEDRPDEACLICEMLNGMLVFEVAHVASMSEAEMYLAGNPVDIVLLDTELRDLHGLEAVRRVRASAPRVSIILLTNPDNEAIAVQAMQEGVQDYVIKGRNERGELARALLNAVERRSIEEVLFLEKERAQATLNCIGDAVICADTSGRVTYLNPAAERLTGWLVNDAVGREMTDTFRIVDAATREPVTDPMAKAAPEDRSGGLRSNSLLIRRDGYEMFIEDSVAPIHDREGRVTGAVIVFRDITATAELERMRHFAYHDPLTGLPNRLLLNDRLGQAIALARRQKGQAAVLFLDLDGFKEINDSRGHSIGDRVLQSVAKRLLDCVRGPDTVSRQGGDEFIVLLQELKHPDDAAATAERLLKAVEGAHCIDGQELFVRISIGVSIYPIDGLDAEMLIGNADTAMYHAKKLGKHSYEFFKPEMIAKISERESIARDQWLNQEKQEILPRFEPGIDLAREQSRARATHRSFSGFPER